MLKANMVKEMYPCVLLRSCHMLNSCTAFPVREVSKTTGTSFDNKTTLGPEKIGLYSESVLISRLKYYKMKMFWTDNRMTL